MKSILLSAAPLLLFTLPACTLAGGNTPVFQKPAPAAIAGLWQTDLVSSATPDRGQLLHTTLRLSSDGSYEFNSSPAALASPLLPATTGHWKLIQDYSDFDPGSRPSWAIRFTARPPGKSNRPAFFVNSASQPQLLFIQAATGSPADPLLRMKKID